MLPYWRERFPMRLFLPVAIALAVPSQFLRPNPASLATGTALALLLLAQFRLWDDLKDRGRDSACHPERVLVRTNDVRMFVVVCVLLSGANLAVVALRPGAWMGLGMLGVLNLALGTFYALRTCRSAAGDLLGLAKYPAFVSIVGAGHLSWVTGVVMALVFAGACIYEAWHDPTSPVRGLMKVRLKPDTTGEVWR
jgi:hypothetical protein